MEKHLSLFSLALILLSFAACSGQNDAYYANWEGEYEATEIIEQIASNGEKTDLSPARTTTVTIFRDNSLYLQSYSIGDPFMPGVDPTDHTVRLKAPARMTADDEPEEQDPEEGGIENVIVTDLQANIVLINGGVATIYSGVMYAPKAIRVINATENELTLLPGKSFEVLLIDANGTDLGSVTCNWTYSPVRKNGDTYTWEAELHQAPSQSSQYTVFGTFRHTLTMTKKTAR